MPKVNLEREEVFPLRTTYVQPGGFSLSSSQAQEGVVINVHIPECSNRVTIDLRKFAQKHPGQINQVNSLIDQLSSATKRRVGSPLTLITDSTTMTIPGPYEHDFA